MEIKVHDMSFSYNDTFVLKDIMMACKEGEITTILGKSGSGKTTLLELIDGLILPNKGSILVGSHLLDAHKKSHFNTLRDHIGYLFQFSEDQFFCKTVKKELEFSFEACHPKENIDKIVMEILSKVGLDETYLMRDPFTLNRIEQKKLGIATILIKDPEVILFDEPFMGLSGSSKRELLRIIHTLRKEKMKTIIIATQDTDTALKVSDFIYVLWNREMRLLGSKYEVLKEEKLMHRYGVKVPNLIKFSNIVQSERNVKIGYRDEINDLIKDVYRYVK